MRIPFAVQSYQSESLPLSAQRLLNFYSEKEPEDAKSPVAVFGVPGVVTWVTVGSGPIRGMHVMNGLLYVLSGGTFYSVSRVGEVTPLGGTVTGNGRVVMADNGTQIVIVNGVNGYVYAEESGFQIITDPDFNAAKTVTFFDGWFVFDWLNTNKMFISENLDGTQYGALDFASAEVASDFVVSIVNQTENLLIFGEKTIETHYDAGAVNWPFLRVDGGTIERGCAAALSPIKEDNSVFFLGDDLVFYRLSGGSLQRVSTHPIESEWGSFATVADCFTLSYTFSGHKFIVLVFPDANRTFVFDVSTGLWHERESWDTAGNNLGRWRGNCAEYCYERNLIGDSLTGAIGYLDKDVYTEFGATIQGVMVSPPIHQDRKRLFISSFEIDIETGVGLTTGQGSNPQMMLDWSKDGGRTWSSPQLFQSMGEIGHYLARVRWTRLGQGRQWIFRLTVTDPVRRKVIAAHADVSRGM